VRFDDSFATIESTWTTYADPFPTRGPLLYGSNGVMMIDEQGGKNVVKVVEASGKIVFEKPDSLPEQLQDIAKAFVYFMETGELPHTLLKPDYNLHGMAILDAGLRSAVSGKLELVNNSTWHIG